MSPVLEDVIDLCERALRGDLSLEELDRAWSDESVDGELMAVREDLVFGLEHTPGSPDARSVNMRQWRQMPEYTDIQRHLVRLRARLT